MKTETRDALERIVQELSDFWKDVYDYDYDREVLWYISEAKRNLDEI